MFWGFYSGNLAAQGVIPDCQSRIYEYDTVPSTHSIIRKKGNLQVIQTQSSIGEPADFTHSFVVKDDQTGLEKIFDVDFHDYNSSNPNYVDITDMEIYGGICYFCGDIIYDGGAPVIGLDGHIIIPRFVHHGLVGRFSISDVLNAFGYVDYCIFDEVKSLTRLAVSRPNDNNYTVVLQLIGTVGNVEDTSCVLEIQHTTSSNWTKTLDFIPTQPEIVFTDILATSWRFIMSSRVKCPDDNPASPAPTAYNHRVFNIQEFSLYGCVHDLTYPYTIAPMQRYYIPPSYYGWHYDEAPMSLCCVEYEDFALAFGVRDESINIGGIRLFSFWSTSHCVSYYYKTGFRVDVDEMCYHSSPARFSVLSKDHTYPNGLITVSNYDGNLPATVKYLHSYNYRLTSLDVEYNSKLKVSGHNTNTMDLSLFRQYVDSLHLSSCFEKSQAERSGFIDIEAEDRYPSWNYRYRDKEFEWKTIKIEARGKSPSLVCKECEY